MFACFADCFAPPPLSHSSSPPHPSRSSAGDAVSYFCILRLARTTRGVLQRKTPTCHSIATAHGCGSLHPVRERDADGLRVCGHMGAEWRKVLPLFAPSWRCLRAVQTRGEPRQPAAAASGGRYGLAWCFAATDQHHRSSGGLGAAMRGRAAQSPRAAAADEWAQACAARASMAAAPPHCALSATRRSASVAGHVHRSGTLASCCASAVEAQQQVRRTDRGAPTDTDRATAGGGG